MHGMLTELEINHSYKNMATKFQILVSVDLLNMICFSKIKPKSMKAEILAYSTQK